MMFRKKRIIVETYNNDKDMQKAAGKMAKKGYEIHNTTTDSRTGIGRKIAGGLIFSRPKVYHTVTYKLIVAND